jgi:hypothetical protein
VHVRANGVPPQMFREGIGVVVEGTMTPDGHFEGNRLMVSHDNEYQAPEETATTLPTPRQLMRSTAGLTVEGWRRFSDPASRPHADPALPAGRASGALVAFAGANAPSAGPTSGRAGSPTFYAASIVAREPADGLRPAGRDFSVSYVAQVGSLADPDWVAVVSLWSSLEGRSSSGGWSSASTCGRHLDDPRPASRVHAVRDRRLARLRGVLQLPDRRPRAAVRDGASTRRRRPRAEPRSCRTTS